jgi:hypothetical protein
MYEKKYEKLFNIFWVFTTGFLLYCSPELEVYDNLVLLLSPFNCIRLITVQDPLTSLVVKEPGIEPTKTRTEIYKFRN